MAQTEPQGGYDIGQGGRLLRELSIPRAGAGPGAGPLVGGPVPFAYSTGAAMLGSMDAMVMLMPSEAPELEKDP